MRHNVTCVQALSIVAQVPQLNAKLAELKTKLDAVGSDAVFFVFVLCVTYAVIVSHRHRRQSLRRRHLQARVLPS
jgi:hypothetical protein